MQPSFLPATILLFLLSFLFLVFNWFLVFTREILISACTITSAESVYHHSSPKRCKLAETTCISKNCNEMCLKTPKSGRNVGVFAKYVQKLTKALNSNWKTRFCFVFVFAKFSLCHVQKHDVFSKIGIQSMWKHLIQLKRSVLSKNWANIE